MIRLRSLVAMLASASAIAHHAAGAQQSLPARDAGWSVFLGCWSTSSRGAVGPMVCVVPADSASRVEFMTVDGDSVISRTVVDASGIPRALRRGTCVGWESSRWSRDSTRLFQHADYRCADGTTQASDAILSMTHADAFTRVERSIVTDTTPPTVVNFIVQLDTTLFPLEVRQRLQRYRRLAESDAALAVVDDVHLSDVIETAMELDSRVVEAWLADRGQRTDLTAADMRVLRTAALTSGGNRDLLDRRRGDRSRRYAARNPFDRTRYGMRDFQQVSLGVFPTGYLITPAMVNFGQPYPANQGGFTWRGWP